MGRLMMNCPETGNAVATGVDIDRAMFDSTTLANTLVGCPECGETHEWTKDDVTFEDD